MFDGSAFGLSVLGWGRHKHMATRGRNTSRIREAMEKYSDIPMYSQVFAADCTNLLI